MQNCLKTKINNSVFDLLTRFYSTQFCFFLFHAFSLLLFFSVSFLMPDSTRNQQIENTIIYFRVVFFSG